MEARRFAKILIFLVIGLALHSCGKPKEMRSLKICIVSSTKIADQPTETMPSAIVSFLNPIEINNIVYIPDVTVFRTDLDDESEDTILIKTFGASKIRSWFKIYDYEDLKQDYKTSIPNLKVGSYLSKEGPQSIINNQYNYSSKDIPFILTDKVDSNNQNIFRNPNDIIVEIKKMIGNGKLDINNKIIILLDNADNSDKNSISAGSTIKAFHDSIDEKLQLLERRYPNDYKYTLERLKNRTKYGSFNKSDEYLLVLAIEKAINEGKASEILAQLKNIKLPYKIKKEAEIQIARPVVKEKPIAEDRSISFRKQQIDAKLLILADPKYSQSERRSFRNITLEEFERPDVSVSIESPEFPDKPEIKSIYDFLEQLRITHGYKTRVLSKEFGQMGKISSIRVSLSY